MRIRRLIAVLAAAAFAFWAPSVIPLKSVPAGFGVASGGYHTADTAYAGGYWGGHPAAAWPIVYFMVGTASVIANAAYVWHTQCRELSSHEAITSTFLPFVGIAMDANASKCRR